MTHQFIAFDLGASNGRAFLGELDAGQLHFTEIHRFATACFTARGVLQWDLAAIQTEVQIGILQAVSVHHANPVAIGVDTWGVDFGLLGPGGKLLGNPVHYRDQRTETMPELAFELVGKRELYQLTGQGFNRFNSVFQLLALSHANSPQLQAAERILMMGDLIHYHLSGRLCCEVTNACTTQLLDPRDCQWVESLLQAFKLPRRMFPAVDPSGLRLGPITAELAAATGVHPDTSIITPATHDTAIAIAAIPMTDPKTPWAYISCGTWSILGTEMNQPIITDATYDLEFANEMGVDRRICFHKTFIGLWLLQECRRKWADEELETDYARLVALAEQTEPFTVQIDVDDPRLYAPEDMEATILLLCREAGGHIPRNQAELLRCIFESIALKYRRTLHELDRVLDRRTERIHLVGGGAHNALLCQLTADACGVPVYAGPAEAAVMGNLGLQARALGLLDSLEDLRRMVANSSSITCYTPQAAHLWNEYEALGPRQARLSRS